VGPSNNRREVSNKRDMSKVKCFACNKMGHYVGQCPNRKKKKQGGTTTSTEEDEFASQFEREMSLLVSLSTVETPSSVWYIDSGASSHMSGVREHFTDLTESGIKLEIVLGNNTIVRAAGRGTVSFQRELRPPMVFRDVLYVPGLKKNLISVSTIQDRGFEVSFRGDEVLIYPKGSNITSTRVIGTRDGKLYRLSFQPLHALASSNNNSQLCELWHRRMAHLHHGALRVLREIVTGLPQFDTEHQEVCRGCALGKYTKTVFPSSDSRSTGILDLVHSDVCGPMSSVSLGGCEYYVTFIDDHSRRTWIYFLKTKSEVFKRFQEFKALVENQTGRKIKVLRSDNGGEYTSTEFRDFCTQEGIRRQLTVPYNPQQNGVAERKNMAIVGATRSMLHDQGLPFFLWVEACSTAVYLQNKSPHRALGSKTPEEAFTGRRPDVGHLRIFGCLTFSHVPSEKRTKLDPTTEKGILVGYNGVSKAYRIYIPTLRRVVVRRDVRFEEDRAFQRSCELRDRVEEVPQMQDDTSQGTQPQVSITPSSGVTGPPSTTTRITGDWYTDHRCTCFRISDIYGEIYG
jgi:hypothetical protein